MKGEVSGKDLADYLRPLSSLHSGRIFQDSDYRVVEVEDDLSFEEKKKALVKEKIENGASFSFYDFKDEKWKTLFWKEKQVRKEKLDVQDNS